MVPILIAKEQNGYVLNTLLGLQTGQGYYTNPLSHQRCDQQ
jgi:hypothetical protein